MNPCIINSKQRDWTAVGNLKQMLQEVINKQGSFPAGTLGNGVPKVILTVGTAFKPALDDLYKKHPVCTKIRLFEIKNRKFPLHQWGGRYPFAHLTPPTVLELGVRSPIC